MWKEVQVLNRHSKLWLDVLHYLTANVQTQWTEKKSIIWITYFQKMITIAYELEWVKTFVV
jgi:hypothetical protein